MEGWNPATASFSSRRHPRIATPRSRVATSSSIGSRPKRPSGSSRKHRKVSAGSMRRRATMPPQGGGSPIKSCRSSLSSGRGGAVPSGASCETDRARPRLAAVEHLEPVTELVPHRLVERQIPLFIGGKPVASEADLRQGGELARERLGGQARRTATHDPIGEADLERFLRGDRPPGQDHVESAAMPDKARQSYGAAIDQRHSPSPAERSEERRV